MGCPSETTTDRPSNLKRTAARGGLILVGSRLATQVFTWAVTIQVSRLLDPIDYAVMTAGMVVIGFCDLLAEAGIGKALVFRHNLDDDEMNEAFTLSLILSTVIYGAVFATAHPIARLLNAPEAGAYLRVVALGLFLIPFKTVAQALVERRLKLVKQSYVNVVCMVFQSTLQIVAVWRGAGYWSFAVVALTGRLLELGMLMRGGGWTPRLRPLGRDAREIMVFGLHLVGTSLLWFSYSNADFLIVGAVAGSMMLGYYGLAFQLITIPVQKLTSSFNQISYPIFCRMRHDRERVRSWYLRLLALLGLFGEPAMIGMALVARDSFHLILGEKWLPAVPAFQVMSLAGAVMVLSCSLPPVFTALGRPDVNLRYTAVCALILPASFFGAAKLWGMLGVCLVWSTLYPLIVLGLIHFGSPISGFGVRDVARSLRPVFAGTAVMSVAVLGAHALIGDAWPVAARLVADIAVGAASYAFYHWFVDRSVVEDLLVVMREVRGSTA